MVTVRSSARLAEVRALTGPPDQGPCSVPVLPAGRWNKAVLVLVALSAALLAIEKMIGATILANVLLLLLAMGVSILATLVALVGIVTRLTIKSVAELLASVAPIAYVVARFALNSVPAGYGP